jgi:hypothetical protein
MNHNFQISNCDTDSISFCNLDFKDFSHDHRKKLINEINEISPEFMDWADDGYYKKVIILKAKNYIMQTHEGKITYKGSALKSSKTEPALREFLYAIIQTILDEKYAYSDIYEKYIKEALNVKDINRWASKKSLSETTYKSTRTNETKIIDAIQGTEYKEGDKVFLFFLEDGSLCLSEKFTGQYDKNALISKLYNCSKVFTHIYNKPIGALPAETFLNYSLKKNQKLLEELNGI